MHHVDTLQATQVSKDAVWFSVKESEDGGAQHVLVVTDNAKAAKKYQLQEIPQQDAPLAVVLEGLPAPVEVPVPAIRAALLQVRGPDLAACRSPDLLQQRDPRSACPVCSRGWPQRMMDEDSDSSNSDEEDCPTTSMTKKGKATATAELPQTVEENPLAAQQAAALLAAAPGPGGEGGAAAEAVLGLVAKEQRRKVCDVLRVVEACLVLPAWGMDCGCEPRRRRLFSGPQHFALRMLHACSSRTRCGTWRRACTGTASRRRCRRR